MDHIGNWLLLPFLVPGAGCATSSPGLTASLLGPWTDVPLIEMPTGDTSLPTVLLRVKMLKAMALTGLAAVLSGCASRTPAWKEKVEWPTEDSARLVGQPMEAGAALAAAGAVREMMRTNPYPDLFHGCSSPEQGLEVVVFTGPTPGLFYEAPPPAAGDT